VSVIDITALIASPFFGLLVDWTGLNGWLVTLGNLFGVTGFMMLGLTMVHPLVGILCIGVHYCFMAAALSPCVSILVDEKFEGTAYSFVSAFVNLGGAGKNYFIELSASL
jgi:MFS family permease